MHNGLTTTRVLAAARSDPTGLVRALDQTAIDEVQLVPELSPGHQESVDDDRRAGPVSVDGLSHHIPGSDDGFDSQAICILQKEPTSEKSQRIENAVF